MNTGLEGRVAAVTGGSKGIGFAVADSLLREGATDEDLVTYITSVVMEKEEGHHINEPGFKPPSRSMVFIGG